MNTQMKENGVTGDNLNSLVSKIEVARQIDEYDWELLCGPYADIEHAKVARDGQTERKQRRQHSNHRFY